MLVLNNRDFIQISKFKIFLHSDSPLIMLKNKKVRTTEVIRTKNADLACYHTKPLIQLIEEVVKREACIFTKLQTSNYRLNCLILCGVLIISFFYVIVNINVGFE